MRGERLTNPRLILLHGELRVILLVLALAVVLISVLLYRHFAALESTDDAEIDGYIYPVSSRIPGYVTRVTVDNNQHVEAGTVLVCNSIPKITRWRWRTPKRLWPMAERGRRL